MDTNDIVSAEVRNDELQIIVKTDRAASFYNFLKANGVNCTNPKPVVWGDERQIKQKDGTWRRLQVPVEDIIVADGTMADFIKWVDEWYPPSK